MADRNPQGLMRTARGSSTRLKKPNAQPRRAPASSLVSGADRSYSARVYPSRKLIATVGSEKQMAIANINPKRLGPGPWVEGYVLDYHSISSTPTGDPYYRFDTKRTELGELLFRLKYRNGGEAVLTDIAETVEHFVKRWNPPIEAITGAPPSRSRARQPVVDLVKRVGERLGLPVIEGAIVKSKVTPQMKDIDDWGERQKVLAEAVHTGNINVRDRSVLLLDDLTESGSTLRRSAEVLLQGEAKSVYALVLTRTR